MLIIDDNTPLVESFPIIIPIIIKIYPGKEPEIKYYPEFEEIAEYIAEKYKNPLSDSALIYLNDETEKIVTPLGYQIEPHNKKSYIISYTAEDKKQIKTEKIKESTVLLEEKHLKIKNITTVDTKEMLEYDLKSYITIQDDMIVSIASINPFSESDVFELNVQTAPKFRGNGYAVSNVSALAYDLLSDGKKIVYDCRRYNRGSQKTADSAGLCEYAKFYMMACYKL